MKKSRAYRTTRVKNVDWDRILQGRESQACCVGMDVSKDDVRAVLRWPDGEFERPCLVANPQEVGLWSTILARLALERTLTVALEPSGTYGDAMRQALQGVGIIPHRVSAKAAHDFAEVFDGVPSQHDGKDAAVVAELAALGKSVPWPCEASSESDQQLALWVDWLDIHRRESMTWCGRLEGLLARHWPEAWRNLTVRSATLLQLLAHYGGPAPLATDPQAARRLARWGGRFLSREKIQQLLGDAQSSQGVRQTVHDLERMRKYAAKALAARGEMRRARREVRLLGRKNAVIQAIEPVVGLITACVLYVYLGDPGDYHCGAAYRKAMGLNLKERSSGRWQGQLKITKRGHSQVRRWLYLSALRSIRKARLWTWYQAKKEKDRGRPRGALVGIMRRLALAIYRVRVSGEPFDAERLFPGRKKA